MSAGPPTAKVVNVTNIFVYMRQGVGRGRGGIVGGCWMFCRGGLGL